MVRFVGILFVANHLSGGSITESGLIVPLFHLFFLVNRNEFPTTQRELRAMAAAA